jgi:RNA methyltransferase, TrmH family
VITSLHNKRVAKAVRLKKRAMREKDRRFLVEGAQAAREAIASGAKVFDVFHTASPESRLQAVIGMAGEAGIPVHEVSDEVMGRLTSTVTPPGLVAVAAFVDVPLDRVPEGSRTIPVLVEVRDPGNAGTIVRSADAAGADAVVFARSSVDVYNEKAVRATAGSLFHLPIVREVEVEEAVAALRDRGFAVLATDAQGEASIHDTDLTRPTAFLFGNEARGLTAEASALADRTVRVPIAGRAESLNLAAATALVLFEAARQRAAGPSLAAIVSGAAHDIRSPLAALLGFSSTMLKRWDRLDDEQKLTMIEGIAHDGARMRLLVSELVDAARLAEGSLRLRPAPVDLLELAGRVARDAGSPDAPIDVTGAHATAHGDADRLHTVMAALAEAAQWWGERGPVLVEVRSATEVRVSRRGSAFDAGTARNLFAPRQAGTGGGSKVGLFVAKGLVEAHGGTIEVEARDGIHFVLRLPRAAQAGSGAAEGASLD